MPFAGQFLQAQSQCADREPGGQPCYSPDSTGQTSVVTAGSQSGSGRPLLLARILKGQTRVVTNQCEYSRGYAARPTLSSFCGLSFSNHRISGRRGAIDGAQRGGGHNWIPAWSRSAPWNNARCNPACLPAPYRNSPDGRTSPDWIPSCTPVRRPRRVGANRLDRRV